MARLRRLELYVRSLAEDTIPNTGFEEKVSERDGITHS